MLKKEDIMDYEIYLTKDNNLTKDNLWTISKAVLIQEEKFTRFIIFNEELEYNYTKIFNNNVIVMINCYPIKHK